MKDFSDCYFSSLTENKIFISQKSKFLEIKFLIVKSSGMQMKLKEEQVLQHYVAKVDTSSQQEIVEPEKVFLKKSNKSKCFHISGRYHQVTVHTLPESQSANHDYLLNQIYLSLSC